MAKKDPNTILGGIRRAATGDGRKNMDTELKKMFPENKKKKYW